MNITTIDKTSYENALVAWMKQYEGQVAKIYADDKGYPTIGIGYAIITKDGLKKNWETDLRSVMPQPSLVDYSKIAELIKKIQKTKPYTEERTQTLIDAYYADAGVNGIELSATEQRKLLVDVSLKSFENDLATSILPYSNERVAYISQIYRLGSAPSLRQAIIDGNRAEAWFQICYDSNNKGGISFPRVIAEANLFGLYDQTPNDENYKDIMRMARIRADKIASESARSSLYGDISQIIQPAKNYLINTYANGVTIDGEVIVGVNEKNDKLKLGKGIAIINDYLQGTEKNDLIFAEEGKDTLIGGEGSDVLYGGAGDDVLVGDKGG